MCHIGGVSHESDSEFTFTVLYHNKQTIGEMGTLTSDGDCLPPIRLPLAVVFIVQRKSQEGFLRNSGYRWQKLLPVSNDMRARDRGKTKTNPLA